MATIAAPTPTTPPDGFYYAYSNSFDLPTPWMIPAFRSSDLATWNVISPVMRSPGA